MYRKFLIGDSFLYILYHTNYNYLIIILRVDKNKIEFFRVNTFYLGNKLAKLSTKIDKFLRPGVKVENFLRNTFLTQ